MPLGRLVHDPHAHGEAGPAPRAVPHGVLTGRQGRRPERGGSQLGFLERRPVSCNRTLGPEHQVLAGRERALPLEAPTPDLDPGIGDARTVERRQGFQVVNATGDRSLAGQAVVVEVSDRTFA